MLYSFLIYVYCCTFSGKLRRETRRSNSGRSLRSSPSQRDNLNHRSECTEIYHYSTFFLLMTKMLPILTKPIQDSYIDTSFNLAWFAYVCLWASSHGFGLIFCYFLAVHVFMNFHICRITLDGMIPRLVEITSPWGEGEEEQVTDLQGGHVSVCSCTHTCMKEAATNWCLM